MRDRCEERDIQTPVMRVINADAEPTDAAIDLLAKLLLNIASRANSAAAQEASSSSAEISCVKS